MDTSSKTDTNTQYQERIVANSAKWIHDSMMKSKELWTEIERYDTKPPSTNYTHRKSSTDDLSNSQRQETCEHDDGLPCATCYRKRTKMRLTNLYQIFDTEAQQTAGAIFPEKRDAPAIRAFYGLFKHTNTMPGQYPQHFELRLVGVQDEETGQITAECPPIKITDGNVWLAAQNTEEKC